MMRVAVGRVIAIEVEDGMEGRLAVPANEAIQVVAIVIHDARQR